MDIEKIKPEIKDIYKLPEENIVALEDDSELLKKLHPLLRNLPWPMEIQGSGHTYPEKKEFKIWYPHGDKYLSLAVVIHELGHLRQEEIDSIFAVKEENRRENIGNHIVNSLREDDAWLRGWERVDKHLSEEIKKIEEEFKQEKKMKGFKSFKDYYEHIAKIMNKLSEFYEEWHESEITEKDIDDEKKENLEAEYVLERIKEDKEVHDFFINIDDYRVGQKISKDFIENIIKKCAEKIANEKHPNEKSV